MAIRPRSSNEAQPSRSPQCRKAKRGTAGYGRVRRGRAGQGGLRQARAGQGTALAWRGRAADRTGNRCERMRESARIGFHRCMLQSVLRETAASNGPAGPYLSVHDLDGIRSRNRVHRPLEVHVIAADRAHIRAHPRVAVTFHACRSATRHRVLPRRHTLALSSRRVPIPILCRCDTQTRRPHWYGCQPKAML